MYAPVIQTSYEPMIMEHLNLLPTVLGRKGVGWRQLEGREAG